MKNIFGFLLVVGIGSFTSAQLLTNQPTTPTITNSNVLLDGSTNFSTESGALPNVGKGIIIPSVNLVNFEFDLTLADGATFPTYFDGMLVYNNASGNTLTTGNRSSTATAVTPGYYYFYNPAGGANGNVTAGVWRPMGGASPKVNVTTAETATNTLISGTQVYAIKGTFQTNGTSTTPLAPIAVITDDPATLQAPAMYGITIYKAGTNVVYDRSVYSYNPATGVLVTGSPRISVVYPQDTYEYVLEYVK